MTELAQASAGNTPAAESSASTANASSQPVVPSTPPAVEPSKTQSEAPKAEAKKEEAVKETSKDGEVKAEAFALKVPEGVPLDPAHVEKIATFAKERGLSQEQAQALLDRDAKAVSEFTAAQEQNVKAWRAASEADPDIGGEAFKENVELAKRVVHRFGRPSFLNELDKTGFGNHPDVVHIFAQIGKQIGEDRLVMPGTQTQTPHATSPAEVLYGSKHK